ncbi:integrase core domain-containing protein (plasmid) [Sulfitobacter pontiacus]|nr:integrase core domain-containing protein [Sulfitobacter pontiacus]
MRISMDGRGRSLPSRNHAAHNPAGQRSNISIERLWRSLEQEAIYLEEISDGFQARRVIKKWITFYNTERPHSALDRQTPDDAYWAGLEQQKAA